MNFFTLMKRPSAFLPVAMSLVVLAVLLGTMVRYGGDIPREPDEGTEAHIFQLLMAAQVPIVLFFTLKWLPQFPKQGFSVLAIQAAAYLAALAPVFILGL